MSFCFIENSQTASIKRNCTESTATVFSCCVLLHSVAHVRTLLHVATALINQSINKCVYFRLKPR